MGKSKIISSYLRDVSPEEAVLYIDAMQKLNANMDEPTQAISIRIPANILRALKIKAKSEGKKYQSLLVDFVRQGLKN